MKRKDIPEYFTWKAIKSRCYSASNKTMGNYQSYGIQVCDEWINDFDKFMEDMGRKPTSKHTIERIDGKKNYSKENCRWATAKEQSNNTRSNRKITYLGETKNLVQWSEKMNIRISTLCSRLNRGWTIKNALTRKVKTKT